MLLNSYNTFHPPFIERDTREHEPQKEHTSCPSNCPTATDDSQAKFHPTVVHTAPKPHFLVKMPLHLQLRCK